MREKKKKKGGGGTNTGGKKVKIKKFGLEVHIQGGKREVESRSGELRARHFLTKKEGMSTNEPPVPGKSPIGKRKGRKRTGYGKAHQFIPE